MAKTKLSRGDKKGIVIGLLENQPDLSTREISKQAGASLSYVSIVRKKLQAKPAGGGRGKPAKAVRVVRPDGNMPREQMRQTLQQLRDDAERRRLESLEIITQVDEWLELV